MKNTLETRLGLFFALAFIAVVFIIEIIGGLEFFKGGYRLQAHFNNVLELKEGDPVKMAGKQIGRVERIRLAGDRVQVVMKIVDKDTAVKTDSKATVKFSGLLGQNYVAIGFGSPQASKAETDTELATVEQPDLSALMARLENVASGVEDVTKSFSGIKLGDFLAVTMDVLNENRADIRTTITNLQTISSRIVEGEGTVGLLIKEKALYDSALAAMTNLNDSVSQIKGVVDQAKTTISKINEGQGTIGLLATDTALYAEATNAMTNLREILEKINRGQGSIGKLVNDESLYKNARMTLQKLDKATEGLEDQGPLSVLGVAVNSLF